MRRGGHEKSNLSFWERNLPKREFKVDQNVRIVCQRGERKLISFREFPLNYDNLEPKIFN